MSQDKLSEGFELFKIEQDFIRSMMNLIEDFHEISPERHKEVVSSLESVQQDEKTDRQKFDNFLNKKTKFEQIQFAMFNYMNSVFERSVNSLLKYAITNNDDVASIYINKFIDYEKTLSKPIRDSNYEKATDQERMQIRMDYYDQIISLIPSNWQILLNIPDSLMWKNKFFKYEYTELRARRNLLTHRGSFFDKKYVNEIKNSITKSKKSVDLKEGFNFYNDQGFFGSFKTGLQKLDDLCTGNKTVRMPPGYIFHVFKILIRTFNLIRLFSDKHGSSTTELQVNLINLGIRFKHNSYLIIARLLTDDHLFASPHLEEDEENNIFIKGNYLLACLEEKKIFELNKIEYKKKKNEEIFFEELKEVNIPIVKLLITMYQGESNKYEAILNSFENKKLYTTAINWPIFNEIKKNDRLLEILKTKIKD